MKLKTLKDLEIGKITWPRTQNKECVRVSELRQEAIRWLKALTGRKTSARTFIMTFFNITEEDLNA